ncbi:MAG: SAF domain-containing protein [Clostridiales bacterium]|nr:SAF domain-containing protein [Clostridiales bacterium]
MTVYVANQDIKAGERIYTSAMAAKENDVSITGAPDEQTAGAIINRRVTANVYQEEIYTSLPSAAYITEDMLGSVALIDISAEQPIMANMVQSLEITQDSREYEISAAALMVDQTEHDVVDVRIVFPNGEDYLVLAKKQIQNLSLANSTFWTYMNEDEILRFSSALIDAFQTTGTRIYTTRYVAATLQEEAVPNYLVRSETIDLMREDPNIYARAAQTMNAAARLSLEARLGQLTPDQLNAVNEGFGLTDTAKSAVLQEQIDNNASVIGEATQDDGSFNEEAVATEFPDALTDALTEDTPEETAEVAE